MLDLPTGHHLVPPIVASEFEGMVDPSLVEPLWRLGFRIGLVKVVIICNRRDTNVAKSHFPPFFLEGGFFSREISGERDGERGPSG